VATVEGKDKKTYALKIRRIDASRSSMEREALFHKTANSVGVGPLVYASSENFILMDYVDGWNIGCWLGQENTSATQVRNIVRSALEQCYKLDLANLDHGELSYLNHHLLVSKDLKAQIIDFESSSLSRPTRNVTSVIHALLISGRISKLVGDKINFAKHEELLPLLRLYKRDKVRHNFEEIMKVLD
jgi:putative serine/threonine protein kinase